MFFASPRGYEDYGRMEERPKPESVHANKKRRFDGESNKDFNWRELLLSEDVEFRKRRKERRKRREKKKKMKRGMNKNRGPFITLKNEIKLCPVLAKRTSENDPSCFKMSTKLKNCNKVHDVKQYLASKPPDLGEVCYTFQVRGLCPSGLKCRYGSKHISEDGYNIVNSEKYEKWLADPLAQTSYLMKGGLHFNKCIYDFTRANNVLNEFSLENKERIFKDQLRSRKKNITNDDACDDKEEIKVEGDTDGGVKNSEKTNEGDKDVDSIAKIESEKDIEGDVKKNSTVREVRYKTDNEMCEDIDDNTTTEEEKTDSKADKTNSDEDMEEVTEASLHNGAKSTGFELFRRTKKNIKKIDWKDKLFLAPLTTLGNLPFRRICKEFGADITCGEMAMAVNLVNGCRADWVLTRRFGSEDIFGAQVCGSNPVILTKCAQMVEENADIDFVDLNVGCPIDHVFKQGAGSGLLIRKEGRKLLDVIGCMKKVLNLPLTVKMRTGVIPCGGSVYERKIAPIIPDMVKAGVDLITVHGRSREQRYTKLADWDYIEECAKAAAPVPLVGNGDILSYEDYKAARERAPTVAAVMIGRGALIKPWIFKEIKEQKNWDISSTERFVMLEKYCNYGLEHWGSNTQGVENTRHFLLEWLSFLHRYVPVGLLDGPQKMNERPPQGMEMHLYSYRDELERIMASPYVDDWIKISEQLLGPVPEGFKFVPKHDVNSASSPIDLVEG